MGNINLIDILARCTIVGCAADYDIVRIAYNCIAIGVWITCIGRALKIITGCHASAVGAGENSVWASCAVCVVR